jgi:predicted ATPase
LKKQNNNYDNIEWITENTFSYAFNILNFDFLNSFKDLLNDSFLQEEIINYSFNNFKAFGEKLQEFKLKPITLIYAPNSVGKSSFLHSLMHLQYFLQNHTVKKKISLEKTGVFGDEIDLGGFVNYIHKHEDNGVIEYEIKIKNCNKAYLKGLGYSEFDIHKEYFFIKLIDKFKEEKIQKTLNLFIDMLQYESNRFYKNQNYLEKLESFIKEQERYKNISNVEFMIFLYLKLTILKSLNNNDKLGFVKEYIKTNFIQNEKYFKNPLNVIINLDIGKNEHESVYYFSDDKEIVFSSEDIDNEDLIIKEIDNIILQKTIQYIGPLRFYPERNFILNSIEDKESNSFKAEDLWALLKKRKTLKNEISNWLSRPDKLKSHYEIVVEDEQIFFLDKRTNTKVSHKDLGLGISQVLPILISSYFAREKLIMIEQPELHLHPAVQAELADEIVKSYIRWNNNFVVETHSEYLLLRLMRIIRHTSQNKEFHNLKLTNNDIGILYIDQDENEIFIKEIRLDESGKLLDIWPGGFFEEGFKERFDSE